MAPSSAPIQPSVPRRTDDRPNPSASAVVKIRLRYAKRGKLRFTSHRDVARAFERAIRRAGLPMAYSQGFNPHPRLSWIGAAPTGAASEAEYVELQLVERVPVDVVAAELTAALPTGLVVLDAVTAGPGALADRIEASRWHMELPGTDPTEVAAAAVALLAAESALVQRMTKDGVRTFDARAALVSLHGVTGASGSPDTVSTDPCGILVAVVRQASPAVRPDDVLSALDVVAGLRLPVPAKTTRMAQGRLDDDGHLVDPLAADRVT